MPGQLTSCIILDDIIGTRASAEETPRAIGGESDGAIARFENKTDSITVRCSLEE